ncbi:MAG TPA: hypothetical protein VGQ21_22175, partial [Thermoanaerobaculia bacterium]|nr:hypothetical protein [Thermoanaerobaculia bacterium]
QTIKADAKSANQTVRLTIGTRWFQWTDGNDRGVYDFSKRLAFFVDPEAHRLVEMSLYANLTGREAELDNRLMLGGALDAGKAADNPMAPTMAEHQLSLRRDGNGPSGIERKITNETLFVWHAKEFFAYSTQLVPLAAADRDLYIRYVRYTVGGHPEILDDLQKLDGIPKWLRYRDPAFGTAVRLEVMESKTMPDAPYVLPVLLKASMKNTALASAAAAVTASTPESRAAALARILTAANQAADAGKPLQAMLGYLERNLMIGGDLPPDFHARKEKIVHDANVQALVASVQASSEAQAKENVATLNRLALLAGEKAYVVGIFRANMESPLGNGQAAIDLFVAALSKNPFITGVWKDLGDSLDTGYDAVDTWRCYEIARIIAPAHGLLAGVADKEAAMLKKHPEYF